MKSLALMLRICVLCCLTLLARSTPATATNKNTSGGYTPGSGVTLVIDPKVACAGKQVTGTVSLVISDDKAHTINVTGPASSTINPTSVSLKTGESKTVTITLPTAFGEYTYTATIAEKDKDGKPVLSPATAKATAVKVEMDNPTGDPTKSATAVEGKNEFTFNTASPGVCAIKCVAKLSPSNDDTKKWAAENVSWSISSVAGSTIKWKDAAGKETNKGHEITCELTNLPSANSSFGNKTVTMTACSPVTAPVQIFFDKWSTNHPVAAGEQAGTPNWYYYWKQTSANSGTHTYDAGLGSRAGKCVFNGVSNSWVVKIGSSAGNYATAGTWDNAKGIDYFANVYRHEGQHRSDMIAQWGASSGFITGQDTDGDYLRHNPAETPQPANRETTITPPRVTGHYDPTNTTTFRICGITIQVANWPMRNITVWADSPHGPKAVQIVRIGPMLGCNIKQTMSTEIEMLTMNRTSIVGLIAILLLWITSGISRLQAEEAQTVEPTSLEARNAILANEKLTPVGKVAALARFLDQVISEASPSIQATLSPSLDTTAHDNVEDKDKKDTVSELHFAYRYTGVITFMANPTTGASKIRNPQAIREVLDGLDEMPDIKNKILVRDALYIALAYAGGEPPASEFLKLLNTSELGPITVIILQAMRNSQVPIRSVPRLLQLLDDSFYFLDDGGTDLGEYNPKRIYPVREAACEDLAALGIQCEKTRVEVEQYEDIAHQTLKMPTTQIKLDRQALLNKLREWMQSDDPQTWSAASEVLQQIPDADVRALLDELRNDQNLSPEKRTALKKLPD